MPASSSHDDPIDFTLGDPTALLGLHLGSDPTAIAHTHTSIPQCLPSHPQLLSSPITASPDLSQHSDPRRYWDAWNPLLVTNPQPLFNLPPVPTDLRPTYSYQRSTPSESASQYNSSLQSSDSGYKTRSTTTASSYAVDTASSPQLASPQSLESAGESCSSPDQDNQEGTVQSGSGPEYIKCDHPNCKWSGRCPSDKRKHEARHKKLFKCDEPNCARREGFGTINDLARHKKCVHKKEPMRGPKVIYMCFGQNCTRKDKMWPRLDNFKQHLTRMHGNEDAAELLKKSEEWYQEYVKTQTAIPDGLPRNDMGFFGRQDSCTAVIPSQTVTSSDFQWSLESETSKTVISESSHGTASLQSSPVAPPMQSPLHDQATTQSPLLKSNDQPPPRMKTDSIRSTETARDRNVGTIVTEAAGSVINAMSKLMDRNQHRQQQQLDEGVDMMNPNSELCGRKKELLQKIFAAALDQLSSDQSATKVPSDPQPEAGKESWFTCTHCPKRTRLRCEMKKHQKRHERPYGCTFNGCNKTFGSKADWKRHESSQHFHLQGWRCTMPDPDNSHVTCARFFDQQEVYVQHLREQHCEDEDVVQMAMKNSYLDPNGQEQYWCGFCRDIIRLRSRGLAARNERFNHIDSQHIKKGQRIGDWLPLSGHMTKKQHTDTEYDTRATSDEDYEEDDDDDSPRSTCLWDRMSYDGSGKAISVQRNDIGLKKRRRVSPGTDSRKSRRRNSVEDSDCDSTECDYLEPVPELFS